jgi:DNA-binding MarR family transcriptional regulator
MSTPEDHAELAAAVWRQLFDFIVDTSAHRTRVLERYGLTPNDSRALFTLDADAGRTMGSLSEQWGCDASNATWIVDRLEAKGLAERRPQAGDRRVKLVALTPLGVRTRSDLSTEMHRPPDELLALDASDLEALRVATARLRGGEKK